MAKRTIQVLTDDLTGGDATGTVTFAVNGVAYEIDLNDGNTQQFHAAFQPYVQAGRKVGRFSANKSGWNVVGTPRSSALVESSKDQNKAVREWCANMGIPVSDRGRISMEILRTFELAHLTSRTREQEEGLKTLLLKLKTPVEEAIIPTQTTPQNNGGTAKPAPKKTTGRGRRTPAKANA